MGRNVEQILNKFKKGQPLGFLVVEPENLKFQYVPQNKKAKKEK